jgi:hypothetical protein
MPPIKGMQDKLKATLKQEWKWQLKGEWTLRELQTLIEVAKDIVKFIDTLKKGTGKAWMQRNLSGVKFQHSQGLLSGVLTKVNANSPTSFVWPAGTVNLFEGWDGIQRPRAHVVHELGHVLENKKSWGGANILGGGPSDALIKALGGTTSGKVIRMFGGVNLPEKVKYKKGSLGEYGNNSVADYFAETFSLAIFKPEVVPPEALAWMKKYLLN